MITLHRKSLISEVFQIVMTLINVFEILVIYISFVKLF